MLIYTNYAHFHWSACRYVYTSWPLKICLSSTWFLETSSHSSTAKWSISYKSIPNISFQFVVLKKCCQGMFWAHTEVLLSEDLFETLFRRQLLIFSSHFSHMFPTHPCSFELGYGQNRTLGGKRHKKSRHHFSEFFCNRLVLGSLAQEPPHWKWLLSSSLAAPATMAPSPPPRILTTCRWKSGIVSNAYLCCLFSECGVHHI